MRGWCARQVRRSAGALAAAALAGATLLLPGVTVAAGEQPLLAPAVGRLLIAAPSLADPNFSRAVVLLLDYDESGAMGVIVNRESNVALREVLPHVEELSARDDAVFLGGPVARDRLVMLLRAKDAPATALHVFDDVYASGDLEVLRATLREQREFRAFAGYAGWGPGQLDAEIGRGDWLVAVADSEGVFGADPASAWERLMRRNAGTWVRRGPGPGIAGLGAPHGEPRDAPG